jgi:hypothetical protein
VKAKVHATRIKTAVLVFFDSHEWRTNTTSQRAKLSALSTLSKSSRNPEAVEEEKAQFGV